MQTTKKKPSLIFIIVGAVLSGYLGYLINGAWTRAEGIPVIPHRAVQMTLNDYEEYDYLIGMDTENIRNMQRISGGDPDEKIYKLLTFTGSGMDVADPWYTGDFEATYRDVKAGCEGLLSVLREELA